MILRPDLLIVSTCSCWKIVGIVDHNGGDDVDDDGGDGLNDDDDGDNLPDIDENDVQTFLGKQPPKKAAHCTWCSSWCSSSSSQ